MAIEVPSNFGFVRATIPELHGDCAKAESYLVSDPRAACIYARRAAERLVYYVYDVLGLPRPYRDDLAARLHSPDFKRSVDQAIIAKLNYVRKIGNAAVHEDKAIQATLSLAALRELHHVLIWTAFRHSAHPELVPTSAQFDPEIAKRAAPLTRDDVVRLADKFRAADAAHAAELANKDELLAAHQREIAELRAAIKAAQDGRQTLDHHDYDEAATRDLFIDLMLHEAGWPLADERDREYRLTGMPNGQGVGYADYVLWGTDGLPLAVIEAKRTSKSPQIGQQQAKLYADCLEKQFGRRPVIFYTSGYEHWLWDDAAGYPPRQVQGFFTRDELELAIGRRTTRLALSDAPVDTDIAGRPYQVRAIKAVGDAFDQRQREALLVMATGSGKTRTVIALVSQLMKANWAKRVLFLADRTALVKQAANAFKANLPEVTTVNLVDEKVTDGRVFVSTYPTMLNLIDATDDGLRRFGPGFFDLIVIDEAHRSVYAKYGALFEYFDALLVGLTATPKDDIDHNTYRLFHLEDGVPTDAYSLEEAVSDGWLVPPKGVSVGTKFLAQGIRYADLTDEEKDQWDALDWGEDDPPAEVGAEELNRFLFNEDTVDKVLGAIMADGYRVAGGDRLGKTIIFAKSQAHAEFVAKRFDLGWPELAGRFARVITHGTPYAQSLIDDFSVPDKPPHIAISVDMLDTGIDVPDVCNLVFFKLVRSKSKFWQMIGRGTRLRPDLFGPGQHKRDFLVFDFCGNLEFFSQDLPGAEGPVAKPLSQRLFEARVALVAGLSDGEVRADHASYLHTLVAGMTLDNVLVRPHRRAVERFADLAAWTHFTHSDAAAALALATLPSSVRDEDEAAKRFDLVVLRRELADLEGDRATAERLREAVQAIAASLLGKTSIPSVAQQAVLLESVAGDEWWVDVTPAMLEAMRKRVRGLVRFVDKAKRNPVYTDFEDQLGDATAINLPGATPGTDLSRFRSKVWHFLQQHCDHVALQKLRRNKQMTTADLEALEEMLISSGTGAHADITWAAQESGGLGIFVRSLVGLDREAANEAFADFLQDGRLTLNQVRFVGLIVDELTAHGIVEPKRLFESPYTDYAAAGPEVLFPGADVDRLVTILVDIKSHAEVA